MNIIFILAYRLPCKDYQFFDALLYRSQLILSSHFDTMKNKESTRQAVHIRVIDICFIMEKASNKQCSKNIFTIEWLNPYTRFNLK